MRSGYIILCRFNSSRLPGKILREIGGKPLLQILLERLGPLGKQNIVLATSTEKTDDPIAEWCNNHDVQVYRGSLDNVALRFLEAAEMFHFEYATRINGDNLFADPAMIRMVADKAVSNNYDFVSNVPGRTYPTGMSVETVRVAFFSEMYKQFNDPKYFEHVTLYLYDHPEKSSNAAFVKNETVEFAKGNKMAIDTAEDLQLAEKIMHQLGNDYKIAGWETIVQLKQQLV